MRNEVILRTYRRERTVNILQDRWEYKRKSWFTDQLWKLLLKLGCLSNSVNETVDYYTAVVNTESVGKAIMQCLDGMHMMYIKPSRVYMGPEEFDRHLFSGEFDHSSRLDFTVDMGYNKNIYGLPVSVIPHMSGILVV